MHQTPAHQNSMHQYPTLYLRSGADRRLRAGHTWIYSNEVDTKRSSLKLFNAGDCVRVENAKGQCLGLATINPQALICARLLQWSDDKALDQAFFEQRIASALALRQRFYDKPYYRLVYGDSDGIPGLVVDRFGDVLVAQLGTAGMEAAREAIIAALEAQLAPSAIVLRNDGRNRKAEGLDQQVEVVLGEVEDTVPFEENGTQFLAPVLSGQKTGWFYDHRHNRNYLQGLVKGQRVLDVFSYIGGWGVQAAQAGASEVYCVDSSQHALDQVQANAALNGVAERMHTAAGQAFEVMKAMVDAGERFDVVVLDPPAFIQRRKDIKAGEQAYQRGNDLALRLLNPGGVLVSASCSMHLQTQSLRDIVQRASHKRGRRARLLHSGGQGPDHPIHPLIPETEYLKAQFYAID